MSRVSDLLRDYLAEIYQAGQVESNGSNGFVSTGHLADRLFASQSTVNRVIERLRTADLVEHQRYTGVRLTPNGQREAQTVVRKQAIIETFLVDVMGFDWHEIYEEAWQLRHHVSHTVLERMWQVAGYPPHSPFGEPITPEHNRRAQETTIVSAEIGCDYHIARVLTRQADRLEYLAALGLKPGSGLHLLHKAPFDGPIQIQLEREYRIIGHELAKALTVIRVT